MDSQGPSLSKGFPEQETGASYKLKNSNGESRRCLPSVTYAFLFIRLN